jgi:beta-lactam-binding protein with PASTA domain
VKFFFSKIFFKQIFKAGIFISILFGVVVFGLKLVTYHNEYKIVPDLKGLYLYELDDVLLGDQLRYEIIDSSKFSIEHLPLTVISHIPNMGDEVKKNRKIYLTVNPSGYRKITVPNIIQITIRNAETMINSVGFKVGEISYKNNIGKDMVLGIFFDGKEISPGMLIPKKSKIDLVLGNGKR